MYTDIVTILLEASKPHFNQEGRKEKKEKLGLTRACETEFYAGKWTAHI